MDGLGSRAHTLSMRLPIAEKLSTAGMIRSLTPPHDPTCAKSEGPHADARREGSLNSLPQNPSLTGP